MTGSTGAANHEARQWFESHWDPTLSLGGWWDLLIDAGWAHPSWPARWGGRELGSAEATAVVRERMAVGAYPGPIGIGTMLAGPTLLDVATSEQLERWMTPLCRGDESWVQLFSEPAAGSDLAAVRTSAVAEDDSWRVDGQKVWSSGADIARWGVLLARTDWKAPKHRGLTYFVIDMDQPGVEVRPIRQMNGGADFCEVFFDSARVPDANRLGDVGAGWAVALRTLAHERTAMERDGAGVMGQLDRNRPVGDYASGAVPDGRRAQLVPSGEEAWNLALDSSAGQRREPLLRQELARLRTTLTLARLNDLRGAGPESVRGSMTKLLASSVARTLRDLPLRSRGPHATLVDDGDAGRFVRVALTVPAVSIAGGTDEIQRNLIAERGLGLPREPAPDRDAPLSARDI